MKKMLIATCLIVALIFSSGVYACENGLVEKSNCQTSTTIENVHFDNGISFKLTRNELERNDVHLRSTKKYTSDSYEGTFYYTDSGDEISKHDFTAKFSYDGTMASCYDTKSSVKMVDSDAPFHPKAENEGRDNLTPTNVFGHVTFILYNSGDESVNNSVTVKIYCNQKGETNVKRLY